MIRSQEKRSRRISTRNATKCAVAIAATSHCVCSSRILAHQAAREQFERELTRQREPSPEVTVQ